MSGELYHTAMLLGVFAIQMGFGLILTYPVWVPWRKDVSIEDLVSTNEEEE